MLLHKKKILVFIDWFLPGFKAGGPIRSMANLTDHLKDEFDFFVVTRDTDYTDTHPYPAITSNAWNENNGIQVYYFSENNISSAAMEKLMEEIRPDVVYINGIYSKWFSIVPLKLAKAKKYRTIVATRGMLAESAIKVKALKKKIFLAWARLTGLYSDITFHATNEKEADEIKKNTGKFHTVFVADNFPRKQEMKNNFSAKKKTGELKLLSIARIAPEKNTLFAIECLGQVKNVSVEFDLYGPVYDETYWKECEALIRTLPENISVHYKGSIPSEKINEVMAKHHALFMPTRGENFGHIIIESLAAGNPVIISDTTPWNDVSVSNAGFVLPLGDAKLFAGKIEMLARMDEQEYLLFRKAAADYSAQKNNTSRLIERYCLMFS